MEWMPLAFEFAGAAALAAAGWIGRSIKNLRDEVSANYRASDTRMDALDSRLVKCESVDASDAMERLGGAETRIARLEAAQITHEDLGRVYRRLEAVQGTLTKMGASIGATVSEVKGSLEATRGQLTVVCEHLMERGSK